MITTDDIQGHWQRLWLEAPGFKDKTTRVHWMQAGDIYADVRVPLERPDVSGLNSLADLPARDLHILAQAEGFAGHTKVENSVCTWERTINWHGATDAIDAGELSFDTAGRLIEAGVHANYTELWERWPAGHIEGLELSGEGVGENSDLSLSVIWWCVLPARSYSQTSVWTPSSRE